MLPDEISHDDCSVDLDADDAADEEFKNDTAPTRKSRKSVKNPNINR